MHSSPLVEHVIHTFDKRGNFLQSVGKSNRLLAQRHPHVGHRPGQATWHEEGWWVGPACQSPEKGPTFRQAWSPSH